VEYPEFEEKQFETACLFELVDGPFVFSSGQVLEKLVGYDAALRVSSKSVWHFLGLPPPPGVRLQPDFWLPFPNLPPADRLPSKLVSLLLQFKRPHYLDDGRAGQYGYWGGGYFRFHIEKGQQSRLEVVETAVGTKAAVRYSAPAFLKYSQLQDFAEKGAIARNSTFVSPAALSHHRLWSYVQSGTVGYANPDGEEVEAVSFDSLRSHLEEIAHPESLLDHVVGLSSAVGQTRFPFEEPALTNVREDLRSAVRSWMRVAEAASISGTVWLVFGFN
jgi:hypothetical protein